MLFPCSFINLVKIHSTLEKPVKIILGIDPGTLVMGYGLVKVTGREVSLLDLGVLKPGKVKDSYRKL